MPTGLLTPTRVDQSARMPGGLLARSLPAPAGWERGGVVIPFYGCGEPILRDKCVTGLDTVTRNGVAEFRTVPIEQGSGCSTTGEDTLGPSAQDRYAATVEWAMGRQLATDQAATGNPSFADATVLGTVADADFVTAVACLEQAAADAGFGATWVLHAPPRAAAYLAYQGLLTDTGLSPMGATWILSPGYPVQGATTVRLWATGRVWASASTPDVVEGIHHRTNNVEAWARGEGIAVFDPCLLIAIDVTVPACPVPA
jgi:hypothetical protein